MTAEGYYDDSFDDDGTSPPLYTQEYLAAFPKAAPWQNDDRYKEALNSDRLDSMRPGVPYVPGQEAFSDEELLRNGFEKSTTVFRKQVAPEGDGSKPPISAQHPLEPMSAGNKWVPRGGYNTTSPPISPRAQLLREAEQLITGERNENYGTPTQNFHNIAALFNIQFGHMLKPGVSFTGAHVAQAMIHVKQARMIAQPKRDSYLDIAGYAACGWEVQEAEQ